MRDWGLLTGGLGYLLTGGRADVANNIIYPAVRGNYVVTPSHLKGTEPIYFVGAPPECAAARARSLRRRRRRPLSATKQTPRFEVLINSSRADTSLLALLDSSISLTASAEIPFLSK